MSEAPPVLGVLSPRTSIFPGAEHPSRAHLGELASALTVVSLNGVCRYRVHHINATRNARQATTSTVVIDSGFSATQSFQALYIVAPSEAKENSLRTVEEIVEPTGSLDYEID